MMRMIALAAMLWTAALPALALDMPQPGAADPHIRKVPYNPMNRTYLVGEIGRETTITFAPDETILRVTFGTPEGGIWDAPAEDQVKGKGALRNNLPLWPMKPDPTNMQVTTTLPDGSQRIYQFALKAGTPDSDGGDLPDATFGLIFTYPQQVSAEAVAAWKAERAEQVAAKVRARLAVDIFYGVRNWSYVGRPNKAWVASGWPRPEVSDNGELTAFRFIGLVNEPAVFIVDTDVCGSGGNERLAPFTDQDDLKIIKTTAQHFRLRLGDAVMEVCNENWDHGIGQSPGTGTTSPGVIREVVQSK